MSPEYVQMTTFIVMAGALYFILIRPQQLRQKQKMQMLAELKVGDRVITAGGLIGRITRMDDHEVSLAVASGVEVDLAKEAVSNLYEG